MDFALRTPSTFRRLGARLFDGVVFGIFFVPLWLQTGLDADLNPRTFYVFVILLAMQMVFEASLLTLFQKTPGKWLFKLRLVTNEMKAPSFVQCLTRVLVCNFSFFFGWSLYALAFMRLDRTHPADWIAQTRMMEEHDARVFKFPPKRELGYCLLGVFVIGPMFIAGR